MNYSTETLGLLPLASILLSGMHYFVWHSYHWHQYLILASIYEARLLNNSVKHRSEMVGDQCHQQGGGGNRGSLPRIPSVRGPPNSAGLVQDQFVSHIPVYFFKGLVSLYFRVKSACSFALCFMLLKQIMHNYLRWLLHSPLAKAPYVALFDLKPLIEDGNLQVYMYCVHARKELQEPSEDTLEHVKSH